MTGVESILQHAVPLSLVVFRVAGMFAGAPLLAGQAVPRRIAALTAVMFAVAIYPALPASGPVAADMDLFTLAGCIAGEALLGVSIGLIAMLPLSGLSLGGYIMGHQMGLAIAESFDPATNSNSSVVGQLLFIFGVYVFIAVGGLDALFMGVMRTFDHVPIGAAALTDAPLDLFVGVLAASWEVAIRLAAPALAVIFMSLIAMGVIMKTMPQINILTIGFAIKIVLALGILAASLTALEEVIGDEVRRVLQEILSWAGGGG